MKLVWSLSVVTLVLTTLTAKSAAQAGVCGGIFCNTDQDCPDGGKCRPSLCGGNLCSNPTAAVVHPGICPVIGPDTAGVCGGVFCDNDAQCESNQKCCASPCGGFLCTNIVFTPITRDPCAGFTCRNGGTCTAPADRPFCLCPPEYTGDRCERRRRSIGRDPCAYFRCRNGGTCTAPADRPVCECPPGFTGRRCQSRVRPIRRDPCRNFRCRNGGTCTASSNSNRPVCQCPPGFTGRRCETRSPIIFDPCRGFICLNGGFCTAPADRPYCACPSGYTGARCEQRMSVFGTCPNPGDLLTQCGGPSCDSDDDCECDEQCCPSVCGRLCVPAPEELLPVAPVCPGGCPPGETCELRPLECNTPDIACIQALIPRCVPSAP